MAYTIIKSDGTTLCTIPDGTINTVSSSLGLPGRNYSGYGNVLDTNYVHIMENFADTIPPANPMRGQLWFNTSANTLNLCPADGTTNSAAWLTLASTSNGGATFGSVTVTGNILANNITASNVITGGSGVFTNITVSANANIATGNLTTGIIGTTQTALITTGDALTTGAITGTWTISGGAVGNSLIVANGNVYASGVKSDNYYYGNGAPFNPAGTYNNSNVFDYMTGANSVSQFTGNIAPTKITTTNMTTGANTTAGTITGDWSLTTGSRLNATYADLAERFEADTLYEPGTVVELGGDKEITAVVHDLSEDVFGVVSNTAAYLMNAAAGNDSSHPPIAVGGRVLVKVAGKVRKGQRLVSAGNGIARAALPGEATAFSTIGRALTDKTTDSVGTVEAFVSISK